MTITKPKDPLLNGAKIVIMLIYAFLIGGIALASIGAVAAPTFGKGKVLAKLAHLGVPAEGVWVLAGSLVLVAILLGIAFRFMRNLHQIFNTVGAGNPFEPENGNRLQRMGWLTVAVQVVVLPLASAEHWFRPFLRRGGHPHEIGFGLDLGTILLMLILFILARVFRKGAAMQEELEGTV
jgi:Protein of unknown function (DUF2975)